MRLRGRQARFLVLTLGLWTAARAIGLWPDHTKLAIAELARATPAVAGRPLAGGMPLPAPAPVARAIVARRSGSGTAAPLMHRRDEGGEQPPPAPLRVAYTAPTKTDAPAHPPADAPPTTGDLLRAPAATQPFALDAYLFVRPGSGRAALSPAGQLGGSQFAARATYRVAEVGALEIAATARAYAPLKSRGAEAAAGVDVRLLGSVPVRLSVERRQRIDSAGRSAWSAYLAGGLYREAHGLVLDGYGQAGVVGFERRDLFVDGAVRAGRKLGRQLIVGGAVWGAAQPGVARLDVGPRAAWRVPIARPDLTLAVEGRFRVAGQARPGNGIAITLAAGL